MIFDGECGFCRRWGARWQSLVKDQVDFAPYQEVANRFPNISLKDFEGSVQFIERGKHFEGAEAVFRLLARVPQKRWMLFCYQKIPGAALVSEWFYRLVARHRKFFSRLLK